MYAIIEPLSQLKIENVSELGLIKTISLLQVLLSATICRVQSQDTEWSAEAVYKILKVSPAGGSRLARHLAGSSSSSQGK